jgi:DNA mismatch repair protein MutL
MPEIHVLDSETIDKIAAGEVVERPASVVKELVENAIDAGADAITVEIKDGGIEFIRVTDNGHGMDREQIRKAFLRHATSKIGNADDLNRISSLGFRGEALSSIAAVAKVEVITKTREQLTGNRIVLEGAVEKEFSEVGAPDGTTFLVRNLFFNTPVRRKFLKLPATEGGYIADLMEHLALSRPDISFKFQMGNQLKFHTTGSGDLKEVIYRIYGRDVAASLVPIHIEQNGNKVEGYLGKPILVRSNRNFEIYFINGRFIRSNLIARALEEGYREYLMQHKFPLCVLHITMDTRQVDVNVHPTKMDVRFSDGITFCKMLSDGVHDTLQQREMIPEAKLENEQETREAKRAEREEQLARQKEHTPEPFEQRRNSAYRVMEETKYQAASAGAAPSAQTAQRKELVQSPVWSRVKQEDFLTEETSETVNPENETRANDKPMDAKEPDAKEPDIKEPDVKESDAEKPADTVGSQMNLFEERLLSVDNRSRYHIIGQVFDTYWMVQFEDKLFIIDQHAAHEKVKYERLMKQFREKQVASQSLMPPVIVSLSAQEELVLLEYREIFEGLGFEVEAFGGREYALRSVPVDLYGCSEREMFLEVLDELDTGVSHGSYSVIEEKIASMSCKAAVKGNNRLSTAEAKELIDELLTLENPYNCPHGRPTIITMSRYEMDKKFKRIV